VELWNRGSGRRAGELPAKSWHLAMAFVPRRNLLAVADGWTNAPVLNLWNPETLELVRSIPQASAIAALAFSPSGDLGASFHLDPKVRLWSPSSGELLREIPASEAVNSSGRVPLFSPDGRLLALGEMDGGIRLLDVADGRIRELPTTRAGNAVSALAFSPDGRFLACGYAFSDSSIQLWDIRAGTLKATFEGHRGWVGHLCFGSEGKTLYSGSADSTIRIWDSDTRKPIGVLQGHTDGISGLALVPDESALVSCGLDGTARLWAPAAGRRRGSHSTLPIPVGAYSAPFTADSRRFITVSPEHPTIIWDTASATELERIPALGTNNFSVDISPDERLLAVGALDGRVKIWNLADRRLVRTFRPQSIPIFRVSFWEGGRRLLTHAVVPQQRIRVQLWDTSSGAEIPFRGIDVGAAMDLARSADGRLLAVPSDQGVALYDYRAERLLANLMRTPARATAFTEDGRYVGAASDRSTKVWEMASLREVANLSLHANSFVSLAFSPDGRRLVTTGSVGKRLQPGIYVWDYLIGRELLTLPSEGEFGALIRFSPDGNALLRISWSGIADLYRAPSWSEIRARSKATGSRETRSESRTRESGATEEGASEGGAGSTGSRAAGHVPG